MVKASCGLAAAAPSEIADESQRWVLWRRARGLRSFRDRLQVSSELTDDYGVTAMAAFQREILVRFGHCDAAGWVFYPRYFEMISDFVEDWFEDGLAASAPGLFHHKQILTPSVHFTVDFLKPTRYGERLTFNLWTKKLGRTSCELRIEASHQGELRMRAQQILVFISAATARATAIPPELLSRMHRFAVDAEKMPPKAKKSRLSARAARDLA
jgi:4-hydroxybenzoyl-CoA thioesterase